MLMLSSSTLLPPLRRPHLSKSRSERGNGNKDPNFGSLHRSISRVDVRGAAKNQAIGCVNLPKKQAHSIADLFTPAMMGGGMGQETQELDVYLSLKRSSERVRRRSLLCSHLSLRV